MDTDASFHICSDMMCFSFYKTIDMIMHANGVELPIYGIGSIWFCMHDGVLRKVSDVGHVPISSHNLISLDRLDRHGCIYKTRGEVLTVKKSDHIMMRGVLNDRNLYRLVGRVVNNRKSMIAEEPSPRVGGEVNVCTAFDGRVSSRTLDRGLHFDDARGINGDRV